MFVDIFYRFVHICFYVCISTRISISIFTVHAYHLVLLLSIPLSTTSIINILNVTVYGTLPYGRGTSIRSTSFITVSKNY